MPRITLLSDTHSYLDPAIAKYVKACDEIWHAGDFGNFALAEELASIKPLRGVWGNIDGYELRQQFPLHNRFMCEGVDVWMTHIGGYPGKYNPKLRPILQRKPPKLFICGHSHILKVIYDKKLNLLHLNPGAAGKEGFHQVRTLLRFSITEKRIHDLEIIELGKR